MDVEVLLDPGALMRAFKGLCEWATHIDLVSAWAHSKDGEAPHWAALPRGKLRRALIGTQFLQTEPAALRALLGSSSLKLRADLGSTFHPKLVLGVRGKSARALIGSSNFTAGGYQKNTELNVLLSGSRKDAPLADCLRFVDEAWRDARSFVPDEGWLADYERRWASSRPPPEAPPPPGGARLSLDQVLDLSWEEYQRFIEGCDQRALAGGSLSLKDFLDEVRRSTRAFKGAARFRDMPLEARMRCVGMGESTGALGRMKGAGGALALVRDAPEAIGAHLDRLPREGAVDPAQAVELLEGLCALRRVNLGVATRLLAAKRPDRFLPLNDANRGALRAWMGKAPSRPATYVRLHEERLWRSAWAAQAMQPAKGLGRDIWRGRVALLDVALYDGRGGV